MSGSIGVKIQDKKVFSKFVDALEKERIDYHVWNLPDFLRDDYTGPAEVECTFYHQRERFLKLYEEAKV